MIVVKNMDKPTGCYGCWNRNCRHWYKANVEGVFPFIEFIDEECPVVEVEQGVVQARIHLPMEDAKKYKEFGEDPNKVFIERVKDLLAKQFVKTENDHIELYMKDDPIYCERIFNVRLDYFKEKKNGD